MTDPRFKDIGWIDSAKKEVQVILDDKVWHLEKKPTDEPMIDLLTTFTVKADGKMKTRICARGDQQDEALIGNIHATVINKSRRTDTTQSSQLTLMTTSWGHGLTHF
jgi:hypothetical protein